MFGIISLFGIPPELYGDEKSMSSNVSKICPAPATWVPYLTIGAYLISNVSPKTGTVTEKSTKVIDDLLPGIFNPKVLAILRSDLLSCA